MFLKNNFPNIFLFSPQKKQGLLLLETFVMLLLNQQNWDTFKLVQRHACEPPSVEWAWAQVNRVWPQPSRRGVSGVIS